MPTPRETIQNYGAETSVSAMESMRALDAGKASEQDISEVTQEGAPKEVKSSPGFTSLKRHLTKLGGPLLVLSALAWSLSGYHSIPFWDFWGLDIHNVHTFHQCEFRDQPYLIHGVQCGDRLNRAMLYPPLLYWSFVWTRGLSLDMVVYIWSAFIIISLMIVYIGVCELETRRGLEVKNLAFWVLLSAQFPTIFAIERGNSDILVVLSWLSLGVAIMSGRFFIGGSIMAVSVSLKLYPAIPALILLVSLGAAAFSRDTMARRRLIHYCTGGVLTTLAVVLLFWNQHYVYFSQVLPPFAMGNSGISPFSHSLDALQSLTPWLPHLLHAILIVVWALAGIRNFMRDPLLILAGSLAISTYFTGTSYDYNLVTVYPLFLVMFLRGSSLLHYSWIALGALLIAGDRNIWIILTHGTQYDFPWLGVVAQWLWLTGTGCFLALNPRAIVGSPAISR